MIDLESCPFCGGKNLRYEFQRFMDVASIRCMDCGATGPDTRNGDTFAGLYWNCCKSRLKWTKARPRKPGFYFYKSSKGRIRVTHIERLELVHRKGLTAIMLVDGDVEQEIDRLPGQWAGPIPEPE